MSSTRRKGRHCTWWSMITEQGFEPPFCL